MSVRKVQGSSLLLIIKLSDSAKGLELTHKLTKATPTHDRERVRREKWRGREKVNQYKWKEVSKCARLAFFLLRYDESSSRMVEALRPTPSSLQSSTNENHYISPQ